MYVFEPPENLRNFFTPQPAVKKNSENRFGIVPTCSLRRINRPHLLFAENFSDPCIPHCFFQVYVLASVRGFQNKMKNLKVDLKSEPKIKLTIRGDFLCDFFENRDDFSGSVIGSVFFLKEVIYEKNPRGWLS